MTFTKSTFAINQQGRDAKTPDLIVSGWVSADGVFGIMKGTPTIKVGRDDPYRLTHIPTGLAFGLDFMTLADAKLAASRFAAAGAATAPTNPACHALYKAMRYATPKHRTYYKGLPMGDDYARPDAAL